MLKNKKVDIFLILETLSAFIQKVNSNQKINSWMRRVDIFDFNIFKNDRAEIFIKTTRYKDAGVSCFRKEEYNKRHFIDAYILKIHTDGTFQIIQTQCSILSAGFKFFKERSCSDVEGLLLDLNGMLSKKTRVNIDSASIQGSSFELKNIEILLQTINLSASSHTEHLKPNIGLSFSEWGESCMSSKKIGISLYSDCSLVFIANNSVMVAYDWHPYATVAELAEIVLSNF